MQTVNISNTASLSQQNKPLVPPTTTIVSPKIQTNVSSTSNTTDIQKIDNLNSIILSLKDEIKNKNV